MNFTKKLLVCEYVIVKITEYHVRLDFSAEMSKGFMKIKLRIVNILRIREI